MPRHPDHFRDCGAFFHSNSLSAPESEVKSRFSDSSALVLVVPSPKIIAITLQPDQSPCSTPCGHREGGSEAPGVFVIEVKTIVEFLFHHIVGNILSYGHSCRFSKGQT
jgi:hypothetical protein